MGRTFSEQELADFLFDRIIVNCPTCLEVDCLRMACQTVAAELLEDTEIRFRRDPVADGFLKGSLSKTWNSSTRYLLVDKASY